MSQTRFGEQACRSVRAKIDSYIDDELMTESTREVLEHLRHCTACIREAQERRKVRAQLRAAVREVTVPAGLQGRVLDRLRQTKVL